MCTCSAGELIEARGPSGQSRTHARIYRILMYGACILQDTLQDTRTGIPRTYPSCILMYLKYVSYMLSYIRMVAVENFDFGNLRNEPNKP